MNKDLKIILDIFTEYVEHPSTRDKKQWIVKSETDTNDADYIYGIDVVSNRHVVNTLILLAWEASIDDSKSYNGNKEYLIKRYHHDSEYYLRGIGDVIESWTFTKIPEESISFLTDYFKSGYGESEISSGRDYYDYDDKPDYELIKIWFDKNVSEDDKIKSTGYIFFDQMIREISQDMNRTQKNHNAHVEMVKTGIGGYGKVLDEDEIKYAKKSIGEELKAIEKYKSDIATLESFYTQFPKPEVT